jgi:hypothetical protein
LTKTAKKVHCDCGDVGRHERNSVKRHFSYPFEMVRVPTAADIYTISDAWDYGAKVCLHNSQMVLKFPPDAALDKALAPSMYDFFRVVTSHTDSDIREFECRHKRIIKGRLAARTHKPAAHKGQRLVRLPDYDQMSFAIPYKPIHTRVPADTGRVSRFSLSLLYGAIVCAVISNYTWRLRSIFEPTENEKLAARAICAHFSLLYVDERMRMTWLGWQQLMLESIHDGIGAAINKHATILDDGTRVRLTRKQVLNKSAEVFEKAQETIIYAQIFDRLFKGYARYVKSDLAGAAFFDSAFDRFQFKVYEQETTYHYAWIVHENGRRCAVSPYRSPRIAGKV